MKKKMKILGKAKETKGMMFYRWGGISDRVTEMDRAADFQINTLSGQLFSKLQGNRELSWTKEYLP